MNYRQFGNTDLQVSEIGFGAWAIGGNAMVGNTAIGWGPSDDSESNNAIHESLNQGINFFDTADIYGLGHSETLLGKLIGKKKNVIIATKVGNVSRDQQFTTDYSKNYILKACEASLQRLNRETIDYYQLHTARVQHLENGECIEAMELLKQQGKIRYWGLSLNTFEPEAEAEYLMKSVAGSGFQLVLNLINQKAVPLIKKMKTKGYGIIARMPLQFGLLTGKFNKDAVFPHDDHRSKRVTSDLIIRINTLMEPVWELCSKYHVSKTQLALSYILSYPEISTVIPGIRTAMHAIDNTSKIIRLEDADMRMLEKAGTEDFSELMELIRTKG